MRQLVAQRKRRGVGAARPYAWAMARLRLALAQLNLVVGDLDGNVERVVGAMKTAESDRCDLVAFPELAVTGYPPEDLLLKPAFVTDNRDALDRIAAASGRCAAVVGFVDRAGSDLFNAVAVCADGRVVGTYRKQRLPNYEVFDEQRYFTPGPGPSELFRIGGVRVALTICEDAWVADGPIAAAGRAGAELIVNVNGSPYHAGKVRGRELMLAERASEAGCPIAYVNLVGGQDELVFDGASLVIDRNGGVVTRAAQYARGRARHRSRRARAPAGLAARHAVVDISPPQPVAPIVVAPPAPLLDPEREIYEALVLGTRDYVTKNGFDDVVIGLSGGVDSSLVATIAVDALGRRPGARRAHAVAVLERSLGHRRRAPRRQPRHRPPGHRHRARPQRLPASARAAASPDARPDLTEENLQSRIRGVILMALSNKFGWLVLTTGNKSESAVGYSTLYGDTAGGFAVIKDVPKLLVYRLCRDRNARAGRELIPELVLTKPPSAELRPDQRDDQSLPPYEVLDPIIEAYVEHDRTAGELIDDGLRPGDRRADRPPHRPGRVQAPPDPARRAHHHQGLRQGPPPADHQPLPRLSAPASEGSRNADRPTRDSR